MFYMIINAQKSEANRKELVQGNDKISRVNYAEHVQSQFGLQGELGNDC